MSTMKADPTAYRPMKVTANREIEVGFELEPLVRTITLDKIRLVSNWPRNRDFHNDWDVARKHGMETPIAIGIVIVDLMASLMFRFFGEGYLGGNLSVKYLNVTYPDDVITTRAVVKQRPEEGEEFG